MAINKATRQAVYEKYNGRCAYCGREIAYKDMQVDHFAAKRGWSETGSDDISNLMPSCRMCNHYKRANTPETFRTYIQEIPRKLRENYIYKVGVVYGNVIEHIKPIVFFFEQDAGTRPNTNADRIRAMSDEELAKLFQSGHIPCDYRTNDECRISYCGCCEVCTMDWLQQPAEEVSDNA